MAAFCKYNGGCNSWLSGSVTTTVCSWFGTVSSLAPCLGRDFPRSIGVIYKSDTYVRYTGVITGNTVVPMREEDTILATRTF